MRNEYRAYLQQCKEQESLYHQIALSLGLPDSVLVLTPAGKDYIQTKVVPIMQAEERAFLRLTQEQREALTTLIRRTTNYFKEEVEALAVRKETEDDDPTL